MVVSPKRMLFCLVIAGSYVEPTLMLTPKIGQWRESYHGADRSLRLRLGGTVGKRASRPGQPRGLPLRCPRRADPGCPSPCRGTRTSLRGQDERGGLYDYHVGGVPITLAKAPNTAPTTAPMAAPMKAPIIDPNANPIIAPRMAPTKAPNLASPEFVCLSKMFSFRKSPGLISEYGCFAVVASTVL